MFRAWVTVSPGRTPARRANREAATIRAEGPSWTTTASRASSGAPRR